MPELIFYMDESGNRQPDKKADATRQGRDWFAFGGFLIDRNLQDQTKWARDEVARQLGVRCPFHMTDMLSENKGFSWLGRLTQKERDNFWRTYLEFLGDVPVVGMGCVIDRPGYGARGYVAHYQANRWLLCRSAFDIAIERAVKYAIRSGSKLAVVFESDPPTDPIVKGYFAKLKADGLEFDQGRSGKYTPLSADDFRSTLTTIEARPKSNRLLQIADSYIYAIARGKYDRRFALWRELCEKRRISNFALDGNADDIKAMGIKYYCFDKPA